VRLSLTKSSSLYALTYMKSVSVSVSVVYDAKIVQCHRDIFVDGKRASDIVRDARAACSAAIQSRRNCNYASGKRVQHSH
jgi:hypothetical protein